MEQRKAYAAPVIATLSTATILEALGPVSAYGAGHRPETLPCVDITQHCGGRRP